MITAEGIKNTNNAVNNMPITSDDGIISFKKIDFNIMKGIVIDKDI